MKFIFSILFLAIAWNAYSIDSVKNCEIKVKGKRESTILKFGIFKDNPEFKEITASDWTDYDIVESVNITRPSNYYHVARSGIVIGYYLSFDSVTANIFRRSDKSQSNEPLEDVTSLSWDGVQIDLNAKITKLEKIGTVELVGEGKKEVNIDYLQVRVSCDI